MNKQTWIYLGVLTVLVGLYTFIVQPHGAKKERVSALFGIDSTEVVKIEITDPGNSIKLERSGKTWRLTAPANAGVDPKRVSDFMQKVVMAERSDVLLAESSKNYGVFEIDDLHATKVRLFDGKKWHEALFGGRGSVRFPNKEGVYSTREDIRYYVNPNPAYWRDPVILHLFDREISRLDITYGSGSYSLTHRDTTWSYSGMGTAFPIRYGNAQMNKILNGLINLRTQQFMDTGVERVLPLFSKPALSIQITRSDGQIVQLRAVPDPDNAEWILLRKNEETQPLFILVGDRVAGSWIDRFTKSADHFRQ
jgi:hypothetical protein